MRQRWTMLFVGCLLLSLTWLALGSARSQPTTGEARSQFLKDFQRISMNTPPEDALFLRMLIECRKARRGIEVGSANGYGAVNMGIGFERTGGHLWTIDIDPKMVKECKENVDKAGLQKAVTCVEGDALKVLPTLEGEYDFVFLDAVKEDTLKYFRAIEKRLKAGAVVVAHNAVSAAKAMQDFLEFMQGSTDWEMVVVRTGQNRDGMAVCYKVK